MRARNAGLDIPTRIMLYAVLPAVLGGVLWTTRLGGVLLYVSNNAEEARFAAETAAQAAAVAAARTDAPAVEILTTVPMPSPTLGTSYTGAKFEPPSGCYLGAFVESDPELLSITDANGKRLPPEDAFGVMVGKPLATAFTYMEYGQPLPLRWARSLCAKGIAPHIAMEPNHGLGAVQDDAYLQQFAADAASCGGPVFLRFASEMNGDWVPYHPGPQLYRSKFKLVHDVLARRAPNVAMIWCVFVEPDENIDDYYPGDQAVDWVGINVYSVTCHNNRITQPADDEVPARRVRDFYRKYAPRKPIAICEYGATHHSSAEGRERADFAVAKITELFASLPAFFRRVKLVDYFDCNNLLYAPPGRRLNDYSVTNNPEVLAAMRRAVASPHYLSQICAGKVGKQFATLRRLEDGAALQGVVDLSARPYNCADAATVTYYLDGNPVGTFELVAGAQHPLNTAACRPGEHTLAVAAGDSQGRCLATRQLRVTFRAPLVAAMPLLDVRAR